MADIIKPEGYRTLLNLRDTQVAIKATKDYFETNLARELKLTRVSAPLFVDSESGLNDDLNGVERAVSFDVRETGRQLQIVHSLAKWKRCALKEYGFSHDEGLYTDMNAIRRDEDTDNIHSIYVDQWDWERIIEKDERTVSTLKHTVKKIFSVFKMTEKFINSMFPQLGPRLPEEITFITSQALEDMYPNLTPKQREHAIAKKHGAVFLMQIGGVLESGQRHDGRAPDYDDWELNGDMIFYDDILDIPFEVSSMGVRVSEESLKKQLKLANCEERANLPYHRDLLAGRLPYTIGGGIGQSRICMYLLHKAHIGEVQASVWPAEMIEECDEFGIKLL
ncbi:MAG: aspartate--ammonia ligase [Clostridia bacterium]|nr:aspartate--ammonia ligase [Clostridia bacterium]